MLQERSLGTAILAELLERFLRSLTDFTRLALTRVLRGNIPMSYESGVMLRPTSFVMAGVIPTDTHTYNIL